MLVRVLRRFAYWRLERQQRSVPFLVSLAVPGLAVLAAVSLTTSATAQTFVNWESPHVNPIALPPDGSRLLAVNTAAL